MVSHLYIAHRTTPGDRVSEKNLLPDLQNVLVLIVRFVMPSRRSYVNARRFRHGSESDI
jgi:hypothetical protein